MSPEPMKEFKKERSQEKDKNYEKIPSQKLSIEEFKTRMVNVSE